MDKTTRTPLRVRVLDDWMNKVVGRPATGTKPEARFEFIEENAQFVSDLATSTVTFPY